MDSQRRAPPKSPVRSRYADATRKSPMRDRNSADFDDEIGPRTPRMATKSPVRSRYADIRKSPLRRPVEEIQDRDKVGAWVEHVKEDVGYVNKLVTQTDSFSGWLPGEATTTDQNQTELNNKPSASPRKHVNMYGRRHALVSYDDWVEEDDYRGARRNTDLRFQVDRTGFQGVHGNGRPPGVSHRVVRIDSYEPPSTYHSGSNYRYDELRGSHFHYNGPTNHQSVVIKQAEILRKYDELGEEIGRKGKFYGGTDDYVHDEFVRVRRGTVQPSGHNGVPRMMHNYISGGPVPGPAVGHYEEDIRNFQPPRFMPNESPFHDDPCSPRIAQWTTPNESHYYQQQFAGRRSIESSYHPKTEYKTHPNRQTRQAPDNLSSQDFKFCNPTCNNLSSHSRSSIDSKSDGGGSSSAHERAMKILVVVNQNQQLCHPIAGGAPFVICSKCSHLLKLPKKLKTTKKNQYRVQCGSCRTISSFDFVKKKPQPSFQTNSKPNNTAVVPSESVSKSDEKNSRHDSVAGITNRESFDFNNTGYTFPCSDSEPSTELEDKRLHSIEEKLRFGLSPSSSRGSKDDKSLEQTDAPSSKAERPLINAVLPLRPPPGSPLRYHVDYSDLLAAQELGGEEIEALGQDKGTAESDGYALNYVGNAAVPTKLYQDSVEIQIAVADGSITKDQGPYLSNLRDSPAIADVYVNGQPVSRDAVTSAENMAGRISAGVYWYDKRAGFWGLMGSHCLGIIPPFIQEFRAPMPENCSGGDTCIYVNGRELHKHDLDLLSGRSLPGTRYKYYIVDTSGKVEDEDTGRFVVNLGKLAPNVERTGRGFGMRPPEMHNG